MTKISFSIAAAELARRIGRPGAPQVFDVRKREAFDDAERMIASATWRDHQEAGTWGLELDPGRDVVVYCVHGHEVSQSAAALLRAAGIRARYLEGGIEAFAEAGGPMHPKEQALS